MYVSVWISSILFWQSCPLCINHFMQLIVAQWHHMASLNLVNVGLGNGLLPNGTKPLPEPMLIYHKMCSIVVTWRQFHKNYSRNKSVTCKITTKLPEANELMCSQNTGCLWGHPVGFLFDHKTDIHSFLVSVAQHAIWCFAGSWLRKTSIYLL